MRSDRGSVRSDMAHISIWVVSGISDAKSQNVSCADAACGIAAISFHLHGVDKIGKFDGVLDEEHRNVVADEIPVSLLGVELHGKAADVARRIDGSRATGNRREPRKDRGLLARPLKQVRLGDADSAIHRARNSHGRLSRARARCAQECARDRNGRSSPGERSPRARRGRACRMSGCSGCRRCGFPDWWLSESRRSCSPSSQPPADATHPHYPVSSLPVLP